MEIFGSETNPLIISKEKMDDIMRIVKSLKESDLLIKVVCVIIKHESQDKRVDFLGCC